MTTLLNLRKLLAITTVATAPTGFTFVASPAMADPESWVVECSATTAGADGTTICNEGKMLEVSAPNADQKMVLRIGAPTSHCSDITYVINRFPGSSAPIAISRRLAPGEDQIIELAEGWAEEGTFITITGMGHVGGCNVGEMHSWGALTEIYPLEPGPVAAAPAVLVEQSYATECGASTPYEVYPGVASVMCDRRIPIDFISPGPGHDLEITVTPPASHCSTVTYFVNRAGTSFTYGMTERLSPGNPVKLGLGSDWPAGPQTIDIGAVGYVDGCNVGEIHSWGVDVRLMSLN
jgi:hypothetical protein